MAKLNDGYVYEDESRGKWVARVSYTDTSGKRQNLRQWCATKTDANDALDKLRARAKRMKPLDGSRHKTVTAYLDYWLENIAKPRLAERTSQDYSELLARHVKPKIGKKRLDQLRPTDIQSLYTAMHRKGLTRRVRYTHAVLNSALNDAVRMQELDVNPCRAVSLPKIAKPKTIALTPEEAIRFVEAAKSDRYGTMYLVAIELGLRPSEYTALRWPDIDFDRSVITVNHALVWQRKGGGWCLSSTKTTGSRRNVPVSAVLLDLLKQHKRQQAAEKLKAGKYYEHHDFVFCGELGHALHQPNLLRRHFKKILERAELPEAVTPYSLRHTCASLALLANQHLKVISERLGHSTIRLTADTYAHVSETMQQGATETLSALLYAKPKDKAQG